jgi:hypothetical protein
MCHVNVIKTVIICTCNCTWNFVNVSYMYDVCTHTRVTVPGYFLKINIVPTSY